MDIVIIAKHRYARISAQKLRVVVNLIRSKKVYLALEILKCINNKASFIVKKVIESAIANADHNFFCIYIDKLKITKILVDVGKYVKRIRSSAKGNIKSIRRSYSHITVFVTYI